MANTYFQLHIHLVFAVKYRAALIHKEWKEDLHKYITGIFQHNDHKMLQINSMPDHIHIFIGMRPHQSISAIVQNVKTESSKWIKAQKICKGSFGLSRIAGALVHFLIQKVMCLMWYAISKIRKYNTEKRHF